LENVEKKLQDGEKPVATSINGSNAERQILNQFGDYLKRFA